jgi:MoaA/NifB/PqqE/SkfB family radical SAM enzyme
LVVLAGIIRELQQAGCRKVLLTGGEPLLRHDLEELIRSAVGAGIGVDLNSNLYQLSQARADALVAAGLGEASVSFYGHEAFHDQFVRKRGAYVSTVRSCQWLRERGVELDVHGPLWADNLACAERVHELAESLGAASLTFFKVIPGSGAGAARFSTPQERFPAVSQEALAQAVQRLRAVSRIPLRTIGFWGDRYAECEQACSIIGLNADLKMFPCLLSRRRTPGGQLAAVGTIQEKLALLRHEVREGLWEPVCDLGTGSVTPEQPALEKKRNS